MQAVLFADRLGAELAPLSTHGCPAMLTLADRPVAEYTVEDLVSAGIDEIFLVVCDDARRAQAHFASGAMWGARIHVVLSRGEEHPDAVIDRFASRLRAPFVAARADVLRLPGCANFLDAATAVDANVVVGLADQRPIGLVLVRRWPATLASLEWPLAAASGPADSAGLSYAESGMRCYSALDSLDAYHRAALAIANAEPATVPASSAGRRGESGVTLGRRARLAPGSRVDGAVVVGANAFVHPSARLHGPCVIGANCYIDRGVDLRNAVLLPGTYVGEQLHIHDAIVTNHALIRPAQNAVVAVSDPTLVAPLQAPAPAWLTQSPAQLAALLVLLMSLPLWPVALLCAWRASGRSMLHAEMIVSNRSRAPAGVRRRRLVRAWRFDTPIPLLRQLPMLWLAVRGDLRLFGHAPLSWSAPATTATWDRRGEFCAAGLLGPATLTLADGAPDEEIRLHETLFVRERGVRVLMTRVLRALALLFGARAWRASAS